MTKSPKYNVKELLAIDSYLQLYGHKKSFDNLVVLDGYMAAVVCSKQVLMPSQWMETIWGGSQNQPVWDDESDFVKFIRYIANHFSYVESAIELGSYSPMVYDVGKSQAAKYRPWCQGFLIGSQSWSKSVDKFDSDMADDFMMVSIYALKNPKQQLKKLNINLDFMSFDIADTLQTSVYNIYQYFKENISNNLSDRLTSPSNNISQKNKTNKIGRNHPCPCGSGKKYKKCCINKHDYAL